MRYVVRFLQDTVERPREMLMERDSFAQAYADANRILQASPLDYKILSITSDEG